MSELNQYRKAELIILAEEFGVQITSGDTIIKIIKKIEASEDYDKETALNQIKFIHDDRERKLAEEKEQREREFEQTEKENSRLFELEKLRITQASETASLASTVIEKTPKILLKNIMPCFDPDNSDMSLYLTLFERHARKANIEEQEWVTQLLPLMPMKISELIIREPESSLENFQCIKEMLLNRFKLSPEAFRGKFISHQRQKEGLFKDLVFELRTYLEGWLAGLEINTFESLQNLMITDQIKRRATPEMKDHLLDAWSKFKNPDELASKLDEYELVRKTTRKLAGKGYEDTRSEKPKEVGKFRSERKATENEMPNWREKNSEVKPTDRGKIFDKRKPPACYYCSSLEHLKPNCPKWKKDQPKRVNYMGNIVVFSESFAPYSSTMRIHETECLIFRDSGASFYFSPRILYVSTN